MPGVNGTCPDVLTAPLEVYLSAWQAAREARSKNLARLRRTAERRIRSLKAWARIYPVAQPIADYFSARAAELAGPEREASELFESARAGAEARGLRHYERLGAEALSARRALAKSTM